MRIKQTRWVALMIQLGEFVGGVVAYTNYLYPARWGWINYNLLHWELVVEIFDKTCHPDFPILLQKILSYIYPYQKLEAILLFNQNAKPFVWNILILEQCIMVCKHFYLPNHENNWIFLPSSVQTGNLSWNLTLTGK